MSVLDRIKAQYLNDDEFVKEETDKVQIYLHHTAGNGNPSAVVQDWNTDSRGRIATAIVIGNGKWSGEIVQAFSTRYWGYHLGVKSSFFREHEVPYKKLDAISIGVELCAWGQLTEKGGKFYNYVNREVPKEEVTTLDSPHKGYLHYHSYSDEQIKETEELLKFWSEKYDIPLTYNDDIWDITHRALKGEKGVFTHNSVRPDKVDTFPQPELVQMLKAL